MNYVIKLVMYDNSEGRLSLHLYTELDGNSPGPAEGRHQQHPQSDR